jgi:hypothetical protein
MFEADEDTQPHAERATPMSAIQAIRPLPAMVATICQASSRPFRREYR